MTTPTQLYSDTLARLPFSPNEKQDVAIRELAHFVINHKERDVFILNGYAGTGKSTVIGALADAMESSKIKFCLLAPTGRAAKVAGALAGHQASTIHRRIFRVNTSESGEISFKLNPNRSMDTLFFVDESSMITHRKGGNSLLEALIKYVYSAPGCAIVFIGDVAQLPPIGESGAPAMSPNILKSLGLNPVRITLDKPARQALDSGILYNATLIRQALIESVKSKTRIFPKLKLKGFPDIKAISSRFLDEELSDSWHRTDYTGTILITRSNPRANAYNNAIRSLILDAEDPLIEGERIIITKNNYFWGKENSTRSFIANGEHAVVENIGQREKKYGRWFCDVELRLSDGSLLGAKVMFRSLMSEASSVPQSEMQKLVEYATRNAGETYSSKLAFADSDPWLNALQIKYAYCITCHKAQGGQWEEVFIDMTGIDISRMTEQDDTQLLRWLYTAVTRATKRVYLINPSHQFVDEEDFD